MKSCFFHTSYMTWSRRTRRSSVSSGSQKNGSTVYTPSPFSGGNTSTSVVRSLVEERSRPA